MLDTFKARLKAKAKAAGANLSQKRIDAIADRLHAKYPELTEETDHDDKIDTLYDAQDYKDFASVDDYQRAKEAREKKEKEATKAPEKNGSESEQAKPDEMPAWFKPFADELTSLKKEKAQQTIQQKLKANEKLKSIPADFYDEWKLPESDEEIEGFADRVSTKFQAINQHITGKAQQDANDTFSAGSKPLTSAGSGTSKVDPAVKAIAEKRLAKANIKK